jgi:membrane protein required for colicin V production
MNGIDLVFILVLGFGFWQGYSRGIIGTVFNVLAYLFGVVLAFKMAPTTTEILKRMFNSENPGMFVVAFFLNMGIIVFMMRAAANALEKGMQAVYLGFVNRVLGGALMAGIALLIYSVLLWFAVSVTIINKETQQGSKTYPLLVQMRGSAEDLANRLMPFAKEMWDTSKDWLGDVDKFNGQKAEEPPKLIETPEGGGTGIEEEPADQPANRPSQPQPTDEDGIEE